MAEKLKTITELPVDEIVIRNRRRPVSAAGVAAIRASIEELGVMQDPIHVRKIKHRGGEYVLMVGAHRLTAAIELGWNTIPVTCWTCTDDFATLMELDDNLAGAELTALDTAVFLAERKRVYEKMHPETKQGIAGAKARHGATDTMSVATFTTATAEKFGLTDRHIRRLVAAGERLDGGDLQLLRKAPKPITLKDLMEVSKIEGTSERYHVVLALSAGQTKSAAEARRAWSVAQGTGPTPPSPHEKAYKALCDAWARAPEKVRDQFLEAYGTEIGGKMQALFAGSEGADD
jgi:ParB family chromosome partitioning protein